MNAIAYKQMVQRFKSLDETTRKRVLHIAINLNGRTWTSRGFDEQRYKEGRIIRSTMPILILDIVMAKIKFGWYRG